MRNWTSKNIFELLYNDCLFCKVKIHVNVQDETKNILAMKENQSKFDVKLVKSIQAVQIILVIYEKFDLDFSFRTLCFKILGDQT